MKTISRIKCVFECNRNHFYGRYKTNSITVDREGYDKFYIIVRTLGGGMLYDGYWEGSANIEDAVHEALKGSLLL